MAVAPTYPGVYIEEVPSGVHTITGVATSITAFIGYTARGPVNEAVRILSFAYYERAFGPVRSESPVSRAVQDFFRNGGTEGYVVRVAQNARKASVDIRRLTTGGPTVLTIEAKTEGAWGNNLRVEIDYDTVNPASLFNLKAIELIEQDGGLVVGRTETFRNLSMDSQHPSFVETAVNGLSDLVEVTRSPGLAFSQRGQSVSAVLALGDFTPPLTTGYRVAYSLNGQAPTEITVATPTVPGGVLLVDFLNAIRTDLQGPMNVASPPGVTIDLINGNTQLRFRAVVDATHLEEQSSIHFLQASRDSATAKLRLGTANGGEEVDGSAQFRPPENGTRAPDDFPAAVPNVSTSPSVLTVDVFKGAALIKSGIPVPVWGPPTTAVLPTTFDELIQALNDGLAAAATTEPLLEGALASRVGGVVRIVARNAEPNLSLVFGGVTATELGLDDPLAQNVIQYAPGIGINSRAQLAGQTGDDGTKAAPAQLSGVAADKTGLWALEDVDLFNLLVIPEASEGAGSPGLVADAIAYCERRRAFMLIDAPETVTDLKTAQQWATTGSTPMRSRNSALFFPRLRAQDPLKNGVVGTFAAVGSVAGLYARTDAERGVWKAPAGTSATIVGATGLQYKLTDGENGVLNPLGLNCLRTFPVYGTVSWGARTGFGADARADEYKYVPVRRLALYLEESLYRGTQWVVFEPNDEPLWAQIRLNLGAFMHVLFAQGAFQGRTPREAYFVRCDKETTTQNDIDLGRVNIVVGFAPLKPAEFVIIRIQQIAGAIQT
jgi:phage tail sheath protein FI